MRSVFAVGMRPLIVMPVAQTSGGAEMMLLHLLRECRSSVIDVVFLEHGPLVEEVRLLGHNATVFPADRVRNLPRLVRVVAQIRRFALARRATVILGWMAKANLYCGPVGILSGIPTVWYQVDMPRPNSIIGQVAAIMPSRGILTISKMVDVAQRGIRPQRPTQVVYPGVDISVFSPESLPGPRVARAQLGLPPDAPIIGILGRLQRWKGMHTVVDAMPSILARHADVICVVVGGSHGVEPEYADLLAQKVHSRGLERSIVLAGHQPNPEVWMQALDVFVHASNNEPFGLVVLEAMALGKPVVAGNTGGPAELITDGVDGLLCSYDDSQGVAGAVCRYLDDPDFSHRIARAGRNKALEFTTDRYVTRLLQAIESLTGIPS